LSACGGSENEGQIISSDPQVCESQAAQNEALWDYLQADYLWNDQLNTSTNPSTFDSLNDLLTEVRAQVELDEFSYVVTAQEYEDQYINASYFGYGLSNRLMTNGILVKYVFDDGNAAAMGLTRGSLITTMNGINIEEAMANNTFDYDALFGPDEEGYTVDVTWVDLNGVEQTGTMSRSTVNTNTILDTRILEADAGKVGYLVFDSFVERSAQDLDDAFSLFKQEDVTELVLDLRYNSGGYLNIAKQLASQIAAEQVLGKPMFSYQYNKNRGSNSTNFELSGSKPRLNLPRVVVLTTEQTASASEVLINALEPYIDVQVVGTSTRGKPVGMDINKLCDHVVFAINFKMVNSEGYGDYFNGLPADCYADDTINADWGDTKDPLLNEALYLLANNSCSTTQTGQLPKQKSFNNNFGLFDKNTI
ncbi:S41 family peptidase, partial [Pseudoalteromonas sp. MelDa3]|uniref:S41 family peptidase n=1 Tax=Pseudoalteromonas sp. MelDa3 TaxID=888435 RepID=UPI000CB8A6C8